MTIIAAIITAGATIAAAIIGDVVGPAIVRDETARIEALAEVEEKFKDMLDDDAKQELRCGIAWGVHHLANDPVEVAVLVMGCVTCILASAGTFLMFMVALGALERAVVSAIAPGITALVLLVAGCFFIALIVDRLDMYKKLKNSGKRRIKVRVKQPGKLFWRKTVRIDVEAAEGQIDQRVDELVEAVTHAVKKEEQQPDGK